MVFGFGCKIGGTGLVGFFRVEKTETATPPGWIIALGMRVC